MLCFIFMAVAPRTTLRICRPGATRTPGIETSGIMEPNRLCVSGFIRNGTLWWKYSLFCSTFINDQHICLEYKSSSYPCYKLQRRIYTILTVPYKEPANEQIILWLIYMAYKTSIVVKVPFLTLYTLPPWYHLTECSRFHSWFPI